MERASQEAQGGRLWRAKEILSGYLTSDGYQPSVFAAYGRILAQMQDSQEAGKYLFLSGLAEPSEDELVELFLHSVRGKPCEWIYSRFPRAGRKTCMADYPARVQSGLKSLGFPNDFRKTGSFALPAEKPSKSKETLVIVIATTVFLLILLGLFNGLAVVGRWLFGS